MIVTITTFGRSGDDVTGHIVEPELAARIRKLQDERNRFLEHGLDLKAEHARLIAQLERINAAIDAAKLEARG